MITIKCNFSPLSTAITFLLIIGLCVGCATTSQVPSFYRLYSGPPKTSDEVAVVKGKLPVFLVSVDEQPGPIKHYRGLTFNPTHAPSYNSKKGDFDFTIELEPGLHILKLDYGIFMLGYAERASYPFPTLKLDAKPGAEYVIELDYKGPDKSSFVVRQTK